MKVIVDCQYLQLNFGRNKIAGKIYEFIELLADNDFEPHIDVHLLLNSYLIDDSFLTIPFLKKSFVSKNIHLFSGASHVSYEDPKNENRAFIFELIREGVIRQLQPDIVLFAGMPHEISSEVVLSSRKEYSDIPSVVVLQTKKVSLVDTEETGRFSGVVSEVLFNDTEKNSNSSVELICLDGAKSFSLESWLNSLLKVAKSRIKGKVLRKDEKKKLAYVSPIPPQRTGIADYSIDLLVALSSIYDIDVVVDSRVGFEKSNKNKLHLVTGEMFINRSEKYDRVIYHFGNSHFHDYMLQLLECVPGIVLLHDFYLGHFIAGLSERSSNPSLWENVLVENYGYKALLNKLEDPQQACFNYAVNDEIINLSSGVIMHSDFSRSLLIQQVGQEAKDYSVVVPFIKERRKLSSSSKAKKRLGFKDNERLVCSFGFLGETKLNKELVDAWIASGANEFNSYYLVFVGGGDYKKQLEDYINEKKCGSNVIVTGFIEHSEYLDYLSCCDIAVQLRRQSRGETSAAIFDCLASGVPTIANLHGATAELPSSCVHFIKEKFNRRDLSKAIDELITNEVLKNELSNSAIEYISKHHNADVSASALASAIEKLDDNKKLLPKYIAKTIARILGPEASVQDIAFYAAKMGESFRSKTKRKTIYLDVSVTARDDYRTGIQRVVRAICKSLIESDCFSLGYRVEPVSVSEFGGQWHYRTVPEFTLSLMDLDSTELTSYRVEPDKDDIILNLDFTGNMLVGLYEKGFYKQLQVRGVYIASLIYDILPITLPDKFPRGADLIHKEWAKSVSSFDSAICISRTVADEYKEWLRATGIKSGIDVSWFHLGADVSSSAPTRGLPSNSQSVLARIKETTTFLMVGTIEPRKGYKQVIDAFELLWDEGLDINLVIIGREGWSHLPEDDKREVLDTVAKLRSSKYVDEKLFWLSNASDEYLDEIYKNSSCLIAASFGEGFGLPLIEAAQNKVPIIARDIPIFREVASDYAFYSDTEEPLHLAEKIKEWISLYNKGKHPLSDEMPWRTWKDSSSSLLSCLIK